MGEKTKIRRILLALDSSSMSMGALEAAAELAGGLGAELIGLFVEDIDLLRLSELPFATEIGCYSCGLRPVRLDDLERQMRAEAVQMKKALATAATRQGVEWEFRVTRGAVAPEILTAALGAELVIMGKRGWKLSRRLGSKVEVIISEGKGMTLFVHPGSKISVPIVAVYQESEVGTRVLEIATTLAKIKNGKLSVIVISEQLEKGQEIRSKVLGYLEGEGIDGGVNIMVNPTLSRLEQAVRYMGPVVLSCEHIFLGHEALCELVNVTENPVLLVR